MADEITCPVCGEMNPTDQEFCRRCQSRLQPSKGADAPIQPGQRPTKKNTAELEPILPQWLRNARDEARKTVQQQAVPPSEESSSPSASASPQDFLAGLQSQAASEEEETPDWLANITGAKPKPKKPESESTAARWVELGKPDEFVQHEEETHIPATEGPSESVPAAEGELPPWLADLQQPTEQGATDELTSWLRQADSQAEKAAPFTGEDSESEEEALPPSSEPLPDWLKNLQAGQAAADESPQTETPEPIESDSDWLKKLQEPEGQVPPPPSTEIPSWLKEDTSPAERNLSDTPSWLRPSEAFTEEEASSEEAAPAELPDWLKAAAPQSSVFEEEPAAAPASGSEMPDWLSTLQAQAGQTAETEKAEEAPAFTNESLAGENADALFTEMPDWLTSAGAEEAKAAETPSRPEEAESIAPGELPSWVQAMRPVESSLLQPETSPKGDQTRETSGALAGLEGVLPAATGIGPISKPKAYSITLNATEDQLAQSTLLEQILAAETAPEPIASFAPLRTQTWLRWGLALLFLALVIGAFFLQPGFFALPSGEPNDIRDARLIMEALQPSAPVLVVVDYQPALSGELEAIAAPLLEHGMILKQPVLTFISTSPTGGLLAEHLMSGPLKDRAYQRGAQYINLGYLPGGLSGVRAFAQDPQLAAPFDMDLKPAWTQTPLQGISSLSQFAAMIVITDNGETARTWIEQTADQRPSTPLIMVSSAQAAPMIQPYYDSRQVSATVSGLYGAGIVAQSNGDLPSPVKYYWNAFSMGLFLAVVVIVIGALWSFGLRFRERALEGK